MPFSQEDLTALAGLVIAAAGGGFGVAKLQKTPPPVSPSGGDGGETLQAIERVGLKVDSVSRQLGNVKNVVDGLAGDIDSAKHEIERLKPDVAHALGRLAVLESRMLPKQ